MNAVSDSDRGLASDGLAPGGLASDGLAPVSAPVLASGSAGPDGAALRQVVVAVDVGGTSIKAGLVSRDGEVLIEERRPTLVAHGIPAVVAGIVGLTIDLIAAAADMGAVAVGVGLIVPGAVDSVAGIARFSANIGWDNEPLAAKIAAATGLPVALGHDVRTAAVAEARLGAGRDAVSVFFVSLGTGLAAGYVRGTSVDDGATGQAGEFGHMVVRPGGLPCGCGNYGCVEVYAAASRIAAAYALEIGKPATAKDVADRVALGDPVALRVWQVAIDALADALAMIVAVLDPGIMVLGGGLSLAGPVLLTPLEKALNERLSFRTAPPMLATTLGDRAGLLGAGIRAWDLLDSSRAEIG